MGTRYSWMEELRKMSLGPRREQQGATPAQSQFLATPSSSSSSTLNGSSVSTVASDTHSTKGFNNTTEIDYQTEALIAQLLFDDLQEQVASHKGKYRADGGLSDPDFALQVQSEQLEGMLTTLQDAQIAMSLDNAMESDRELINALALNEKVAQQDREAALALSRGQRLPQLTQEQKAIEKGVVKVDSLVTDDFFATLSPKLKDSLPLPVSKDVKGKGKSIFLQPPTIHQAPTRPSTTNVTLPQCVSCDDKIPLGKRFLQVPCSHNYCANCVVSLAQAATGDESLFPVRCCKKNVPIPDLERFLTAALLTEFRSKVTEFGTPAQSRVYCAVATCSAFLGNAEKAEVTLSWHYSLSSTNTLRCDKCRVATCTKCRQQAHPNDSCKQNTDAQVVRDLARAQGWQTCPGCKRVIELMVGCNHMTCICGYEFCYECAAKWKTCLCAQWDEERLIITAEARMERDLGMQARVAQPDVWRREVQTFANNLRVNHDCYPNHRWRGVGGGHCEECGDYLPVFLKMCRDCRLTVCRRCSFNRL